MKSIRVSKMVRVCIVLLALGFMASSCAPCSPRKEIQAQINEIALKADNAMAAAAAAQKAAEDCCVTDDEANAAADRAEAAAERAENAATKAEAVFMKHMKK